MRRAAFLLVHGAWHGAWAWAEVLPHLRRAGHEAVAIDLPGAGQKAIVPDSYRPFNSARFAVERTAAAGTTQAERTSATCDALRHLSENTPSGRVILVGHSLGGLTVSAAAETVPELVRAAVYVSGLMLPPGQTANELAHGSRVSELRAADSALTGTSRINPSTGDIARRDLMKELLYADLTEEAFKAALQKLHVDEPASVRCEPSPVTPQRFGQLPRHYIVMRDDQIIPPATQHAMIAAMDASGAGGPTHVHHMDGSHSPFLAQPETLSRVLLEIAG